MQILSFGFDGPDKPIAIGEEIKKASRDDSWGSSLDDKTDFRSLKERYAKTMLLIDRHESVIPVVEKWISAFSLDRYNRDRLFQLDENEIDSHPYFQDVLFGSALNGSIRRLELPAPPLSLVDISQLDKKLSIVEDPDNGYTVQFRDKGVNFPTEDMDSSKKREMVRLMVESFAAGSVQNMIFYARHFLERARSDLLYLKKLSDLLPDLLVKEAHLSVSVALRNAGEQATVLRQYFAATITGTGFSRSVIMVPKIKSDADDIGKGDILRRMLSSTTNNDNSTSWKVDEVKEDFLPTAKQNQLASMPGGTVTQIVLQSDVKLGEDGHVIVSLFKNDMLECEIFGMTLDGTKVSAPRTSFGRGFEKKEQEMILPQSKK